MESMYAFVCAESKLDPSEGIELSADGVVLEVEKLKSDESKEIVKQIKIAQNLAADVEEHDDDKSEDWTPTKGVCHCFYVHGGGVCTCWETKIFTDANITFQQKVL